MTWSVKRLVSSTVAGFILACIPVQKPQASSMELVADFGANPGDLLMYRHVPAEASSPMPLVLVLHGCSQTGPAYAEATGWVELANRHKFALVVAEQKTTNNQSRCFNWFEDADITRDQGEALSLRNMVAHMKTTAGIDDGRVFVTGLSAGGAMTAVMLALYPDVFAAGAVIAGVPYRCGVGLSQAFSCMNGGGGTRTAEDWGTLVRNATSHTGPWPRVSIWHGSSDTTVRPVNADHLAQQWTNLHGEPETPDDEQTDGNETTASWTRADGQTVVEKHVINGMGHGTPVDPGTGESQCGTATAYVLDVDICSSLEIARFFGLVGG
ncbi:MAG: PHB depolymerase family esterase [Myxococcota bacterium]